MQVPGCWDFLVYFTLHSTHQRGPSPTVTSYTMSGRKRKQDEEDEEDLVSLPEDDEEEEEEE